MSTKTQLITTIAIAAAFLAISTAMPESAQAWWWNPPTRGAPEVDPSTLSSALALAMGGLAVLGDKLRRR
jgi:hypothetical protein